MKMDNYFSCWNLALCLLILIPSTDAVGPLRVYAKGYTRHNLPSDGGWTQWFNVDHPYDGTGDFETVPAIRYTYGTGCDGLPCRRPLAMKVTSVLGFTPQEEDNEVRVRAHRGFECDNDIQMHRPCTDYMVRFFCPHMRSECRKKKWLQDKKDKVIKKKMEKKKWNEVQAD